MHVYKLSEGEKVYVVGSYVIIPINKSYTVQQRLHSCIRRFHSQHHQQIAIENKTTIELTDSQIISYCQSLDFTQAETKQALEQVNHLNNDVIIVCQDEHQVIDTQEYIKIYKYISDLAQLVKKVNDKPSAILIIPQNYDAQQADVHFIAQYILQITNSQKDNYNLHFLNKRPFYNNNQTVNIQQEQNMLKYIEHYVDKADYNVIICPDMSQVVNCFYNQQIINSDHIGDQVFIILINGEGYLHFLEEQGFPVNSNRVLQVLNIKQVRQVEENNFQQVKYLQDNILFKIPLSQDIRISSEMYYASSNPRQIEPNNLLVSEDIYQLLNDGNQIDQYLLNTFYKSLGSGLLGLLSRASQSICRMFTVNKIQGNYIYLKQYPEVLQNELNMQYYENIFQNQKLHFVLLKQ